jgi:hypothetical protein
VERHVGLFHWVSTIKIQLSVFGLMQAGIIIISSKTPCSCSDIAETLLIWCLTTTSPSVDARWGHFLYTGTDTGTCRWNWSTFSAFKKGLVIKFSTSIYHGVGIFNLCYINELYLYNAASSSFVHCEDKFFGNSFIN